MARRGDLLGCKVLFNETSQNTGTVPVVFTINGREIGRATVQRYTESYDPMAKLEYELYPFVGIGWEGVSLLFKVSKNN